MGGSIRIENNIFGRLKTIRTDNEKKIIIWSNLRHRTDREEQQTNHRLTQVKQLVRQQAVQDQYCYMPREFLKEES